MSTPNPTHIDVMAEELSKYVAGNPHLKSWAVMVVKHVVSKLTDAGYSIVPLPEPTDTKDYSEGGNGEDYIGWEVRQGPYFVSVYDQGEVQVSYDGNVGEPISVDYARDLGTALLAAAAAAEREKP